MRPEGIRIAMVVTAIVAATLFLTSRFEAQPAGQGASLHVYTSDGFKPALQALIPQIERVTGRKVSPEFDASKTLQQKIESGERFDAAILSTNVTDELIKSGKISGDTETKLGRAGIGVGVRAGAPKPKIGTPEEMKRTLLSAKSIAFNRDGASAVHINEMVQQLGIADKVKPKFMLETGAGQPQRDVAAGKAELVITLIPEIADFQGLDLVGPLPSDLQSYIDFAGGVAVNSANAAAAKALLKFLASPAAAATLKSKGVDTK